MKNRILALVCCLSLALGCVAYRPPEAKAVAGVDDLFVSLFVSFTSSAGLSYVSNSLDAPSLVDAFAPYLREFEEAKNETISHWMGYDSYDDWLSDLRMHIDTDGKAQLFIPRPMAEKLNSFATWFEEKLGLTVGGNSVSIASDNSLVAPLKASFFNYYASDPDWIKRFYDYKYEAVVSSVDIHEYFSEAAVGTYRLLCFGKYSVGSFYSDSDYFFWKHPSSWYICSFDSAGNFLGYLTLGGGMDQKICPADKLVAVSTEVNSSLDVAKPSDISAPISDDDDIPTQITIADVNTGITNIQDLLQTILEKTAANELSAEGSIADNPATDVPATDIGWQGTITKIWESILALPDLIAQAFAKLFAPDAAFLTEISNTFTNKFAFLPTLKRVGSDLFGMTPDSEPPVIWIHLDKAEGKYSYGGKVKALDMSWYQRYKADMDKLISGFLWLGFLWLLFKRAASIIQGGEMYTEYYNDIRDYYRSGKKDDGPTIPTNRRLKK